jgi:hypothetical protein
MPGVPITYPDGGDVIVFIRATRRDGYAGWRRLAGAGAPARDAGLLCGSASDRLDDEGARRSQAQRRRNRLR